MDRNREARRTSMAANGLSRRRHRSNSLRDSPEEDGPVELQEPARLRDRGSGRKDRDRERDRDKERERDRLSRSSKRRRGDRLMHSSNREDGGEDSSEESVNDEEEDDEDDGAGGGSVRMLPLNPSLNHRKSFPPAARVFKAVPPWRTADEMIGVSVPRKARSASTKRSHECWASSGALVGEPIHRQASTSPVRTSLAATGPTPSPASPSSSNVSVRKKIKPNGPKLRPPKSSSKSSSSAQDEIEIEIAEVLYGMRQPQGPSNNDSLKLDSREKPSSEGKSRVSSPISNSHSQSVAAPAPLSSSVPPQNSSSSVTPLSAVAPKRKRPRPIKYEDENPAAFTVRSSPISSTTKAEGDQPPKGEIASPNFDRNSGSAAENGRISFELANSQAIPASSEPKPESINLESNLSSDSKPLTEESERQEVGLSKEEPQSPKKESSPKLDEDREDTKATKVNPTVSDSDNQREEKLQIDLMLPPPPLRSSPERDVEISFVAAGDPKPMVVDAETEAKPVMKEDEKSSKMSKEDALAGETEKARSVAREAESQKPKELNTEKRGIDLQLDLEKTDTGNGNSNSNGNMVNKKHNQNIQRQLQPNPEKTIQSSSVPLPMSVPGWPGGLPPPMGYMTPLQGVVSMDGTAVSSAAIPPHLLFNQPRPKRCATHCYIARTILYHQHIARINPFWPAAAAGSASLYGAKPCNLNVMPSPELHGNIPSRATNTAQDKGHNLPIFPGHIAKEKGSQAAANMDNAQRKQILLQQALPPGAPNNILHGPTFIFPLNQQQAAAAAAASVRPGSVKSLPATGSGPSSCTSNAPPVSTSVTGATTAPTMSFSYPNMPGNETQYLAILQNNGYPFPIPAHVGGPPAYRGTHAQALPFFNGSFYSSQMLHPSQLQQQQHPAHSQQSQQGHQNTSMSSGSSSSQKHLQNQQQKPHASGSNVVGGSLQGFPASKNQSSQPLMLQQQQQQRQQLQNHHASHPARQIESEMGEDSPSSADSRLSRATMNIYGQNFAMPMQPPNFALMTSASMGGMGANGNHGEKKQPQQHASAKAGVETSQAFAMSFASINGATAAPGLDLSSIAQNHPIMQSHHNFQIMATSQAAQQKKNYRVSEEGKTGNDPHNPDEERKAIAGKLPSTVGQSIAFSRPDGSDPSMSTITGSAVIDSSARTLNIGSASVMSATINTSTASTQQQLPRNQQQQQIIQLQKQHQFAAAAAAAAAARSKTPSASNGSVYSDHLPSTSSMASKFPNAVSAFPQNLVQSSSTTSQSQWKNSARTTTSQSPSPSLASTPSSSVKALPQQQARSQQAHTQISFAANPKSTVAQGQPSGSTQSPSPPVMVASPTTSSMSKSTGSPRTTSTSTSNKVGQASSLSSQQAKNSQVVPTRKSSPGGGRNLPSILSGSHLTPSSTGVKQQLPQQQPQISKQSLQQAQLFFPNAYMHPQASQSNSSTSTSSAASGYYHQRRGAEQQMQRQVSSVASSNGMLSLCPTVSLVHTSTPDSSKVASTANNMKGGGLPPQGLLHPSQFAGVQPSGNHHQFIPPSFPYVHPVPTAVQVKPAEQKQPAGE